MILYTAVHKCRMCGEIYEGVKTGGRNFVVQSIIEMDTGKYTIPQAPHLVDIHLCKNGNIGCADFVGWKIGG